MYIYILIINIYKLVRMFGQKSNAEDSFTSGYSQND